MKCFFRWLCLLITVLSVTHLFAVARVEAIYSTSSEEVPREPLRILCMGKDRSAGLCDSIFLLSVESRGEAAILQIPRDTYAAYTQKDYRKLNGILNALGAEQARRFLARSLGVPIDGYIILDLAALRNAVDAVGGVEVDIPQALFYADPSAGLSIALPQGRVLLDGARAEQFVRFRSGYANADLGRLDAQKEFLRAFARAVAKLPPLRRTGVLLRLAGQIETDLSLPMLLSLSERLSESSVEQCRMETMPGAPVQGVSGAWYYSLCREGAIQMLSELLRLPVEELDDRFDPARVFDRAENVDFHKIYTSPTNSG